MKINDCRKKLINDLKQSGISSAVIDAEILLEFVTKKSREFLLAHPDYELSESEIKITEKLNDRRKNLLPMAYIVGQKEFYGLNFIVTPDVLIPRPETEILVEEALNFIAGKKDFGILDVGTGCGNIIISLAKNISGNFSATDISEKALKVAMQNAKNHNVDINFFQSDIFENISGKFDVIVANLPYVPKGKSKIKMQKSKLRSELSYEPQNAIFADDNGMAVIKKFLDDAKNHVNKNGLILLEVDPRNADDLKKIALGLYNHGEIIVDLANKKRLIKILT